MRSAWTTARRATAAFSLLVGLLGCEPSSPAARTAEAAARGAPAFVDTVPALVILDTVPEAEPQLLFPTGATVLSNGNIVVSDQWASSVRFFDRSGKLVRTVGRSGKGPGEFSAPAWLGQCGPDSVFVWDYLQGQMTVLDSVGTVVREYTRAATQERFRCTRAGRFAVVGSPVDPPRNLGEQFTKRVSAPLRIEGATGDSIGGVGILPMYEAWILGRVTQFAITDERLYVGTADSASLDAYDLHGTRVGSVPLTVGPRSPTEANVQRWLDTQWQVSTDASYREWGKRVTRERSKVPEHLPLYTELAVDPEGLIWVVLSSPGDGETRFQVVGPDATLVADLRVPTYLELYEVGRDYVLGRILGPDDVPGIVMYRLRRAPR